MQHKSSMYRRVFKLVSYNYFDITIGFFRRLFGPELEDIYSGHRWHGHFGDIWMEDAFVDQRSGRGLRDPEGTFFAGEDAYNRMTGDDVRRHDGEVTHRGREVILIGVLDDGDRAGGELVCLTRTYKTYVVLRAYVQSARYI